MSESPNPITAGFRAVRRNLAVVLVEILWRWSFAIVAFLALFLAGMILLGPLNVGDTWESAWRTQDVRLMGLLILNIVIQLGTKALVAVIVVPIMLALLWIIPAALGRRITVRRLRSDPPPLGFRAMLALQGLRAFVTWFSFVLLIAAVVGGIYLATRGSRPDLFLFYETVAPSTLLVAVFWLVTNWYLTVATLFGQEGQSFYRAWRQGRQAVRLQRSDFAGTGFVFLLFRLAVLLVALAICGLTSSMRGSSPQAYFALVAIVTLAYCAVGDFLYLARMAAYLALAAAHKDAAGPTLVEFPDGQTSTL
jgi:hypothetical protein